MTETQTRSVDLLVGGMTCASCVARVEKKLNRLEGVEASVNLATASARVSFDPSLVDEDTLVETVERTGYTATLPSVDEPDETTDGGVVRPEPAPPAAARRPADGRRAGARRWCRESPSCRGCSWC